MNKKLKKETNNQCGKNNIDLFLYLLIRDYLPTGIVHKILKNVKEVKKHKKSYTNGYLFKNAKFIRKELS